MIPRAVVCEIPDKEFRALVRPESLPAYFHQSREKASRFAVLGMLSLGGKLSGYDIRKNIAENTANFWSESYGNIYPVLKRLLAEEAVSITNSDRTPGNRRKHLYSITAKGSAMLKEWLRQPARPSSEDNELLLKLFFSAKLPPAEPSALIAGFRRHLAGQMRQYREIEQQIAESEGIPAQKVYWMATVRYGQAVNEALAAWCEETTAELKKLERRD